MPLTTAEKVTVAEITQETYDTVDSLVSSLNSDQETFIQDRIDVWDGIRDSHVKLSGEVDFDNERKREAIRQALRKLLGLSLVSFEISGYSQSVPHTWIY